MAVVWSKYRSAIMGALGALLMVCVLLILWGMLIVWNRAARGELAYEYLDSIQKAQQQQTKPTPTPHPGG